MRSMWKGSISFGLVTIPVRLYAATESKDVRFNLLHEQCRTPVQYRKWCPNCDREVAAEEIVKGYEHDRGRYVLVAEAEMEAIPVAAAHTIDIVDFVKLDQIDPVYYDRTYYLEPGEGGAKAYALLRRAMEQTGRIAVAKVVIRTKESLAAIRVFREGVLAMETMHFPEEIRSPAGLSAIATPDLRPQEVEMATGLVASLSGEFHPERFQNQYRESLLELIQAKVNGEQVAPVAQPERVGQVADLMEALRASIRVAEEQRGVTPAVVTPVPGAPVEPGLLTGGEVGPGPAPAESGVRVPVPGVRVPVPGIRVPVPGIRVPVPWVWTPMPSIPGVAPTPQPAPREQA